MELCPVDETGHSCPARFRSNHGDGRRSRSIHQHPFTNLACPAGTLGSGGASALNHYTDRNQDRLMSRTEGRPVATNKIAPKNALTFGIVSIGLSLVVSYLFLNLITAFMIFLGAVSYLLLYTLFLKPRTYWNIVIGGVAGVFPALAGWAAATGSVGWPAAFHRGSCIPLDSASFLGAINKVTRRIMRESGFPMLSVVKDQKEVIKWIVWSSLPLLPFSLLPLLIPRARDLQCDLLFNCCVYGGGFLGRRL